MKETLIVSLLLLVGAGCAPASTEPIAVSPHAGHHAPTDIGGSVAAEGRVVIHSDLASTSAAQELRFSVLDASGRALVPRDFKIAHEKLMHLIVVRDDYEEFHHVHPVYLDGEWCVKIAIEEEGVYHAYVDVAPVDGEAVVLRKTLLIGSGATRAPRLVARDIARSGPYEVSVSPLMGPEGIEFAFAIRKDGVQVADVDPYLGAYGHVVMLKWKDVDGYVHMHPITTTPPDDGIVRFGSALPGPGIYPMYAQFSLDGEILMFPFVLHFAS